MDPFPAYRLGLKNSIYVQVAPSFYAQLDVCSALLAISLISCVASIAVRIWRKQFWLFRTTETNYGNLIIVHPVIGWCIFNSLFLILFQGYILVTKGSGQPGHNLHGIIWWRTMIWFPLWFSTWIQAWSTSVAPFTLITRQAKSKFDLGRYPIIINSFFISVPIIFFFTLIPLIYLAGKNYDNLFANYFILDAIYERGSILLAMGGDVTGIVGQAAVVGTEMVESTAGLAKWWKACWIAWTLATGIIMIVFSCASWDYFRPLLKSMATTRDNSATSATTQGNQLKALNGAYKSLLLTTLAVFVTGLLYLATDLMLVIGMDQIMAGGPIDTIVTLLSVWIFSILGTFSNITLLIRSISNQTTPGTSRKSSLSSSIASSYSSIKRKLSSSSTDSQEGVNMKLPSDRNDSGGNVIVPSLTSYNKALSGLEAKENNEKSESV